MKQELWVRVRGDPITQDSPLDGWAAVPQRHEIRPRGAVRETGWEGCRYGCSGEQGPE